MLSDSESNMSNAIFVIKRDGEKQEVSFDKVLKLYYSAIINCLVGLPTASQLLPT